MHTPRAVRATGALVLACVVIAGCSSSKKTGAASTTSPAATGTASSASPASASSATSAASASSPAAVAASSVPASVAPASGTASGTQPVPNRVQPIPNTTGKKIKIAMISFPSSNEFFAPIKHGSDVANAVLSASFNASVDYLTVNDFTEDAVNAAAKTALLEGYNAIGFVPLDAGVCPILQQAVSQGIKGRDLRDERPLHAAIRLVVLPR